MYSTQPYAHMKVIENESQRRSTNRHFRKALSEFIVSGITILFRTRYNLFCYLRSNINK